MPERDTTAKQVNNKRTDTQHVQSQGGVTPTSSRKQVQDISAKFQCEIARNGKVKKSEFYPPPIFFGRWDEQRDGQPQNNHK